MRAAAFIVARIALRAGEYVEYPPAASAIDSQLASCR
jgi:hypothetical protein